MQFLQINSTTTLSELTSRVGARNVDSILSLNSLSRVPNIGEVFQNMVDDICADTEIPNVSYQRKSSILNTFTEDSDIFESIALMDNDGWKVLSALGTIPTMLRIPETIQLPDATDILGNGEAVKLDIYERAMKYLHSNQNIDPVIFNEYSSRRGSQILDTTASTNPLQWFKLPWGKISLHSSIDDTMLDFPVYPKGLSDGVQANYEQMPDLLYQYEPWQVYRSSGPRTVTYKFDMHRDMWTGDHRDGKCNELIRFCKANCYPEFKGAAVNVPRVTLYISGKPHISGILTAVNDEWDEDSPIGLDGFFLHVVLSLTITEVSNMKLNYSTMRQKGLIG